MWGLYYIYSVLLTFRSASNSFRTSYMSALGSTRASMDNLAYRNKPFARPGDGFCDNTPMLFLDVGVSKPILNIGYNIDIDKAFFQSKLRDIIKPQWIFPGHHLALSNQDLDFRWAPLTEFDQGMNEIIISLVQTIQSICDAVEIGKRRQCEFEVLPKLAWRQAVEGSILLKIVPLHLILLLLKISILFS